MNREYLLINVKSSFCRYISNSLKTSLNRGRCPELKKALYWSSNVKNPIVGSWKYLVRISLMRGEKNEQELTNLEVLRAKEGAGDEENCYLIYDIDCKDNHVGVWHT